MPCRSRSATSPCSCIRGYARSRAFVYNVSVGVATLAGALAGYVALADMQQALPTALAIAASSLLYVAVADLIPSLHRRPEPLETAKQLLLIGLGIGVIALALDVWLATADPAPQCGNLAHHVARAASTCRPARLSSPRAGRPSARNGRTGTPRPHRACRGGSRRGRRYGNQGSRLRSRRERFDPQQLAELNAKYQARWEALWSAATAALARRRASGRGRCPTSRTPRPAIAASRPREWRELPYFALLKQGYLLFGEYLNELAALAALPSRTSAGSPSSRSSTWMRSRRRISWPPIPRC
mgnify:CR=1 FL=1